ncbi:hypothetical protein JCM8097_000052 [Rhodosporidiobolus ruineniae]
MYAPRTSFLASASGSGSGSSQSSTSRSPLPSSPAKHQRRKSLAFNRDLFANGERDAVRCRPSSIYVPDEILDVLSSPPPHSSVPPLPASSSSFSSAAPSPAGLRRSSLPHQQQYQHPPRRRPGDPLSPLSASVAAFQSQPRRHSEQASNPFFAPSLPSSSSFAPFRAGETAYEFLASFPPPPAAPSSLSPGPRSTAGRARSSTTTSSIHSHMIRRKPVPKLSLDVDEAAEELAPSGGSSGGSEVGLSSPPVGGEGVVASIEDKVRRMSLETSLNGGTGLGLGLRAEEPEPQREEEDVEGSDGEGAGLRRRKTLAEVKAEKRAARERAGASPTSPSSIASPPPTFSNPRPFALLRTAPTRALPAHDLILSAAAPAAAPGELVEAWMDIIAGSSGVPPPSSAARREKEKPARSRLPPPVSPPKQQQPQKPSQLDVLAPAEFASLASSLPPLVYGAVDGAVASALAAKAQEDERDESSDEDGSERFVDASEGRASIDHSVGAGPGEEEQRMEVDDPDPAPAPSFAFSPLDNPGLVNLSVPKRLNKRSASASFLASPPPPQSVPAHVASFSTPPSPAFPSRRRGSAVSHSSTASFVSAAPSLSALPAPVAPIASPPLAPPAAKRQHLSSPTSPLLFFASNPLPVAPSANSAELTSTSPKSTTATSISSTRSAKDKPLPPRPPRPPKSARRLGRVASLTSSDSGASASSYESVKLDSSVHAAAPVVTYTVVV